MATGILFSIVILVLTSLHQSQMRLNHCRKQQERLTVALMAVQTRQKELHLNGCHITVSATENQLSIRDNEGEIIRIDKK
ncbi:competence type IV pilus minor pilin ComGE [Streptococcus castoreus]|uniref:competence type IV pilus minor pilin ComGE n=1 Tax=Streptococcus castoreus TaxID=254786 RepID=UPI001FC85733|nr:competence type IV pilus minor pilin ComGE [Streptococcus castoreus]